MDETCSSACTSIYAATAAAIDQHNPESSNWNVYCLAQYTN